MPAMEESGPSSTETMVALAQAEHLLDECRNKALPREVRRRLLDSLDSGPLSKLPEAHRTVVALRERLGSVFLPGGGNLIQLLSDSRDPPGSAHPAEPSPRSEPPPILPPPLVESPVVDRAFLARPVQGRFECVLLRVRSTIRATVYMLSLAPKAGAPSHQQGDSAARGPAADKAATFLLGARAKAGGASLTIFAEENSRGWSDKAGFGWLRSDRGAGGVMTARLGRDPQLDSQAAAGTALALQVRPPSSCVQMLNPKLVFGLVGPAMWRSQRSELACLLQQGGGPVFRPPHSGDGGRPGRAPGPNTWGSSRLGARWRAYRD